MLNKNTILFFNYIFYVILFVEGSDTIQFLERFDVFLAKDFL